jgi:hypothetical protein
VNVTAKGNITLCTPGTRTHKCHRFVEFETAADLKTAVEKLDGQTFKGATVHCTADVRVP